VHPNFNYFVTPTCFALSLTFQTVAGTTTELVKGIFDQSSLASMTLTSQAKERKVSQFPLEALLAITSIYFIKISLCF